MKKLLIIALLLPVLCFGQKKGDPIGLRPLLKSVFINSDETVKNINADSLEFTDTGVSFKWNYSVKDDEMALTITNKNKQSFKVLWQESGYVSPDGNIERIFFGGLKYFGRYSEQQPTRVFANTSISNKIAVFSFLDEELKKVPVLNLKINSVWVKKEVYEAATKNTFRFIIVVSTDKEIKEYDFHFGSELIYKN